MLLTIDTAQPLSEADRWILSSLLNIGSATSSAPISLHVSGDLGGTEARPPAEKPTETPSEPAEDTDRATEPLDEDLLQQAIQTGMALVKSKRGDVLKSALEAIGAERVSTIDNNADLERFLAEVGE